MVQKKTTKRTAKKSSKVKDFRPTQMSLAVSATAASSLVLLAVIMVR